MKRTTPQQIEAALGQMRAIGDAIRDLGSVPSGALYVQVMNHISLETYNGIIGALIRAGLVRRDDSHLLTWIGGAK